jgi:hypothetical protein
MTKPTANIIVNWGKKDIKTVKSEAKLSMDLDHMIIYIENLNTLYNKTIVTVKQIQ